MACDDRQLSEAQRQAGFQQQRTGVMRAVRPFSGAPTLDNLIDYINRELQPAVKASRDKVNDVYLQVTDNAPSANPLGYYFSTDTTNGDPTGGRIRLNASPQSGATVMRVSQVNGRAEDVLAWLDVMAGGATTPLGVVTLFDAINPGRFVRFDLESMVDQGAYWDLTVTPIEASHDDPFVEGEAVVISFIAGVASSGTTVAPGTITPIATDTFLGNISGSTAAPSAVPLASVDSTSISYDGTAHEFRRAALTGFAEAAANGNATTSAEPLISYSSSSNMSAERVATSSTSVTVSIATAGQVEWQRAALTGFAVAAANANATTSAEPIVTFSASSNMSNERVLSNGTGTTVDIGTAGQIQVDIDTPLTDGDKGDITVSSNGTVWTIDNSVVTNAKLADMAAGTVKGVQIDGATGAPVDLTGLEVGELIRFGTTQAITLAATTNDQSLNADTDVLRVTLTGSQTLTGITGGAQGRLLFVENISGSGNDLTLASLSASSLTANRFRTPNGVDLILKFRETALLRWETNNNDWRVVATGRATAVANGDYGDITVTGGGATWTIDNSAVTLAKMANLAAGTTIGRQIDAGTGAPVALTGAEQAENWRRATIQTESGVSGTLDILLADDTTVLLIRTTADATLRSLGDGLASAGREIVIEHDRLSGSGNLTIAHNSAGTYSSFFNPDTSSVVLGQTACCTVRLRSGFWRPQATAQARIRDADYGDITVSSGGSVWNIDAGVVGPTELDAAVAGDGLTGGGGSALAVGAGTHITVNANDVAVNLSSLAAAIDSASVVANGSVLERAALTGAVEATQNSNATTFSAGASGAGLTGGGTAILAVGAGTGITVNANDVAVTIPLTDGDKGHIVVASSGTVWTWDTTVAITGAQVISTTTDLTLSVGEDFLCTAINDVVINAGDTAGGVAIHAGLTPKTAANDNRVTITADDQVVLEPTGSLRLFSGGVERVEYEATGAWQVNGAVGTVGHTIVTAGAGAPPAWGQVPTAGIADAAVTLAKLANLAAGSVIGRQIDAGTGVPVALTGLEQGENLRLGTVQNEAIAATTNDLTLNADTTTLRLTPTGTQTLTGITGGAKGRVITIENVAGSGNSIVLASLSASSSTANRLRTPRALDLTLGFRESVFARWDDVNGDWRIIYLGVPLADGDKGDLTLTSGATVWTIDNDVVSNAKAANMAQSTIKGRAEGAGTGDPTDLTPTQVVAIIDGESPTWTGSHSFTGSTHTVDVSAAASFESVSDLTVASTGGGLALGAGHVVSSPDVGNGDVVINATGGVAINAGASPVATVSDGVVSLTADTSIITNSPFVVQNRFRLDSVISPTALSANQNNYSPTGWADANVVRLSTNSATIREITGAAAGSDGEIKYLVGLGPAAIVLQHEDASSTSSNRFLFTSLTTYTIDVHDMVGIWYDGDSSRWRVMLGIFSA